MEFSLTRRLYFAGIPSKLLNFDLDTFADQRRQIELIESTVSSEETKRFPCLTDYKINFLKQLIAQLEENEIEVGEKIYEQLFGLLNEKDDSDQDKNYKIFELPHGKRIICAENKCKLSEGTTGLSHWQGTYFLVHWISEHVNLFSDKHVLELGCGIGLTGLTTIQMCQLKSYTFTDANSSVLSLLKDNIQTTFEQNLDANSLGWMSVDKCKVELKELDWTYPVDSNIQNQVDVVLAADVTYDPVLIADLIKTLKTIFTKNQGCVAYIAHTRRNEQTECALLENLKSQSIQILDQQRIELPPLSKQILPFGQQQIGDCILFTLRSF